MKVEIELAKCRERTKDESVVLLMMEAKVDVLRALGGPHEAYNERLFPLANWCSTQRLRLRGAA